MIVHIKEVIRKNLGSRVETTPRVKLTATNSRYAGYSIGEWTYGEPDVRSWGQNTTLHIGKFCSIADGVVIMLGGEHRSNWVTTYPFAEVIFREGGAKIGCSKGDVRIGNDVWVGLNALILSGVVIGNGAVIAAGAVVTKDVPPYTIVGGNPARVIRHRIPELLIPAMEKISWWDWPLDRIEKALPLLLSSDIQGFIDAYTMTDVSKTTMQ